MTEPIIRITKMQHDAMLAEHGTKPWHFTGRTVLDEAVAACDQNRYQQRPKRPVQLGMFVPDKPDKRKPQRKNAFLPAHIKAAGGSVVKLLRTAIAQRVDGVPPACMHPRHARLYSDAKALGEALDLAVERYG